MLTQVFSPCPQPHSNVHLHQGCFTRIPRPRINIGHEFGIGHCDNQVYIKDHIAVFIPLKSVFDQPLQWYP